MREDRNRPRWDLVLFDLDGTLVDSLPWFLSILPEVAARHRFRVPESDVERFSASRACCAGCCGRQARRRQGRS